MASTDRSHVLDPVVLALSDHRSFDDLLGRRCGPDGRRFDEVLGP